MNISITNFSQTFKTEIKDLELACRLSGHSTATILLQKMVHRADYDTLYALNFEYWITKRNTQSSFLDTLAAPISDKISTIAASQRLNGLKRAAQSLFGV